MVDVKGTRTEEVSISISEEEAFKGLCRAFGLERVIFPGYDDYWEKNQDESGKLTMLIRMADTSYHGSPTYKPTNDKIIDPTRLAAYEHLNKLHVLLKMIQTEEK